MGTRCLQILIVEDEPAHAEAIRRALEAAGMGAVIRQAATLREYREIVEAHPPEIVLLDLNLPDGRAVEVLTSPLEAGAFPVLIMTSYGNEQLAVETMRSGAMDYIVKSPEAFAAMPRTVERALREWNLLKDRKRTEEVAAQVAAQVAREWQMTFDATNDAIWILDQEQRVLRSNRTAERFFHRPLGEMIGKHCWEIVHGTEQPIAECPILRVRKSLGRETMELREGERWLEITVDPILDGSGLYSGAVHIVSDITERKRSEEALLHSETKYRSLSENSPDLIARFDREYRHLYVNASAARAGRRAPEEYIGKTIVQSGNSEDEARKWEERIRLAFETGEVVEVSDSFETPDGLRYFNTRFVPEFSTDGSIHSVQSIARDITEQKRTEKHLQDTLESLRKAVGATIQAMASAVETRDPYTAGHQIRSADLARAIAMEMGLPQDKIDAIRMAGSIHDIGKLSIPAEILSKPTRLSAIEFSLIKEHAHKGYEMLKDVESPWPLAQIIHQHHERMDGSGYPRNLKGDDILIEARVLAVADVVEAMASHRPYRPGLGIDSALNEIEKNGGTIYDNVVADACLRLFREKDFKLEGI